MADDNKGNPVTDILGTAGSAGAGALTKGVKYGLIAAVAAFVIFGGGVGLLAGMAAAAVFHTGWITAFVAICSGLAAGTSTAGGFGAWFGAIGGLFGAGKGTQASIERHRERDAANIQKALPEAVMERELAAKELQMEQQYQAEMNAVLRANAANQTDTNAAMQMEMERELAAMRSKVSEAPNPSPKLESVEAQLANAAAAREPVGAFTAQEAAKEAQRQEAPVMPGGRV